MSIVMVYTMLVLLSFLILSLIVLYTEGHLKEILILSLVNVFALVYYVLVKSARHLAKKKIRRDFNLGPEGDGQNTYYRKYWYAYGTKDRGPNSNNYLLDDIQVIFGKKGDMK